MTRNLLSGLANFLIPVIGICLILFVVIVGFRAYKGQSSMKSLIIGVVTFVLLGGILFFAKGYFSSTGSSSAMKGVVDTSTRQATSDAGNVVQGN